MTLFPHARLAVALSLLLPMPGLAFLDDGSASANTAVATGSTSSANEDLSLSKISPGGLGNGTASATVFGDMSSLSLTSNCTASSNNFQSGSNALAEVRVTDELTLDVPGLPNGETVIAKIAYSISGNATLSQSGSVIIQSLAAADSPLTSWRRETGNQVGPFEFDNEGTIIFEFPIKVNVPEAANVDLSIRTASACSRDPGGDPLANFSGNANANINVEFIGMVDVTTLGGQKLYNWTVTAESLLDYGAGVDGNYTVTVTAPLHGSITGEGEYSFGTTATLTATPDPGYVFTGWTGDASGTDNPLDLVIDAYKTVGANFEVANPTISIISPSNGTLTGEGVYSLGATATLTATPDPGFVFAGWTGDASGTATPLEIVMDTDKTIGAIFEADLSDADSDELSNYEELVIYGTDPDLADTDGDGLSDAWEVGLGRFSIIAGSFTWQQARADAHTQGGELACFPNEDLWNRAMETLGANALDSYTGLWIGLTDAVTDGDWLWVNGEGFDFMNWATSRPSTTPGNTLNYVEVSGGEGAEIYKWYDRTVASICEGYVLETGYATDPNVADVDGDGLNDSQELAAGSNPFLADTDDDGLNDGQEVNLTQTNPLLKNTDGIGPDDGDKDPDEDDLTNLQEINQYGTDPLIADTDEDGLNDAVELNYAASYFKLVQGSFTYPQAEEDAISQRGRVASFPESADYTRAANRARQATTGYLWIGLSDSATEGVWLWTDGSTSTYTLWLDGEPSGGATENHVVIMENSTQWADTMEAFAASGYLFERVGLDPLDPDTDADGLTDGQEVNTTLSDPTLDDTDGDGLLDGPEVNTHGSNPLLVDTDDDGLSDRAEVEIYGSDPSLKDTDSDGFDDGFEVSTGFDPALATSTPEAYSEILIAVEFRFNAANGESYRIESSLDLANWEIVETGIAGAGGQVTRFYTIEATPKRHFRARRN